MPREYHYTTIYELQSNPEALWPFVSDTNRFNRDTGLPPMQLLGIENKIKRVKFKVPLIEMRVDCRLERLTPSGTRLTYDVHAVSRNFLGDMIIPPALGIVSPKKFEQVFHLYDRVASQSGSILNISRDRKLSSAAHTK